ncbi:peptide-methionine (S)-S-oxide reductase MsrA [Legionella nagasakiensis]|uniref:peptide-methionine (S)-S-oxide reductase MsrA n=1 Tax=Legionella nagasakiensis TaxID=535290 RepID=UPI001055DC74|nr:peptide-methionine (S)-S-oxide reductase MsrA [Legionella nagasakiensis]
MNFLLTRPLKKKNDFSTTLATLCLSITLWLPVLSFAKPETAIFAGGCFWCMEADFDKVKGVISTTSGFDGGQIADPTYEQVSAGETDYVESVLVVYDPKQVSYATLVDYYFHHIDPTVKNKQFCDQGRQYRSVIFFLNAKQKQVAYSVLEKIKKKFPVVYTEIRPSTHFYPAETYHQNYYQKNPLRYKYYRYRCGRDARIREVWGNETS